MLTEMTNARQIPGEPARRWFMSPTMDLIVWHDDNDEITGFQLCYDKGSHEKAITWSVGKEPTHAAISTGEDLVMKHKESPILVADGTPDYSYIAAHFQSHSAKLPSAIVDLVMRILSTRS